MDWNGQKFEKWDLKEVGPCDPLLRGDAPGVEVESTPWKFSLFCDKMFSTWSTEINRNQRCASRISSICLKPIFQEPGISENFFSQFVTLWQEEVN